MEPFSTDVPSLSRSSGTSTTQDGPHAVRRPGQAAPTGASFPRRAARCLSGGATREAGRHRTPDTKVNSISAPLPRWLTAHPHRASRILVWAAVGLTALTAGSALLFEGWETRRFVLFYVAPIVPAVVLWGRERLRDPAGYSGTALGLDVAVFILSGIRFLAGIFPFSGHMLFLTYALCTVPSRPYRLLALALWVETGYFKFFLWDDPRSWAIGLVCGLAIGAMYRFRA